MSAHRVTFMYRVVMCIAIPVVRWWGGLPIWRTGRGLVAVGRRGRMTCLRHVGSPRHIHVPSRDVYRDPGCAVVGGASDLEDRAWTRRGWAPRPDDMLATCRLTASHSCTES